MIRKTIRFYEVGIDPNPKESCYVGVVTTSGTVMSVVYSKKYDKFNVSDMSSIKEAEETRLKVKYWFRLFE